MDFPLSKPIEAHGEKLDKLTLREPTTGDLMDHGIPIRIIARADGATENEINGAAMGNLIAALAGIPPSSVRTISPKDFIALVGYVAGFFN